MTAPATLAHAESLRPDLVALRRAIHRDPEIGLDLPETQRRILEALDGLDLEITLGRSLSSVVAVLRGRGEPVDGVRQVVLLRGDMDALPVTEETGVDYASERVGTMHACGHDLHVAGLVGAARILHAMRDELAGDVVFMFQPGEEGPGGARIMIEEGLLDVAGRRVDAAYAVHVTSSDLALGRFNARPGPLMAAADEVTVRVVGAGGHGSQPHRARDPIPATCEIVVALHTMVTREFDVFDPVVVTVGRIAGGTADNIIPDDAEFEATIRTLSAANRERMRESLPRLARGIAAAHGLEAEVDYRLNYPVTVNDAGEYAFARSVVEDMFGADRFEEAANPELGSEDFSFVLDEVPGAFLFLGACPDPDFATAPDNHSPRAAFDDVVLPDAAAWLAETALRRLRRTGP